MAREKCPDAPDWHIRGWAGESDHTTGKAKNTCEPCKEHTAVPGSMRMRWACAKRLLAARLGTNKG